MKRALSKCLLACSVGLWLAAGPARAQLPNLGFAQVPHDGGHTTTYFYPLHGEELAAHKGPFQLSRLPDTPLLQGQLRTDAVGDFGGSAGGHTALTMAGGVWSPARFRDHCAAGFDPASLAAPRVPQGLITAGKDINQIPRFHIEAIKAACLPRCTDLMTLPEAGHGARLPTLPPLEPGSIGHQRLSDPPGFDRASTVPRINARIADRFVQHLTHP